MIKRMEGLTKTFLGILFGLGVVVIAITVYFVKKWA